MSKRCNVVCDTRLGLQECELLLDEDATVADALAAAEGVLGRQIIDWSGSAVGVFGEVCARDYVPADGDRIELYRALKADPRAARRARVARAARISRRRGT